MADDATLPPRPRRACERLARTADSGTGPVAGCLPARGGLLVVNSGGGDTARSLRGLTLRGLGTFGDDFRFLVAFAEDFSVFQRVALPLLEGENTVGCVRTFGMGVESILAMSNGLNPIDCWLDGAGVVLATGGCPASVGNVGRARVCATGCYGLTAIGV